ncbi:MAG: HD-GYP domain-containing protein [Thermodesulfobacteriota bacterium]
MFQVNPADFIQIPTMLVSYDCGIKFDVYIRKGENYFLFAKHGQLNDNHKHRLRAHDVDELYIHSSDIDSYDEYIELNFSNLLHDQTIPMHDRSRMLYDYSLSMGKSLLQSGEKSLPTAKYRDKLESLAGSTYDYLSRKKGAAKSIAGLLSHNYRTYSHCVNVSVYTMLMLVALEYGRSRAKLVGTGAILHDIGKVKIPKTILDKPGRLSDEERDIINTHPGHGLDICREMDLDTLSQECIVQHHEKLDGSGYPYQTRRIPEHVRIVTIADIFDALTSVRPYSRDYTAFDALRIISKDAEAGKLDKDLAAAFVMILSEGQIVTG